MFQTYLKSLLITEFGISFYTEIKIKLIQNSVPQSSEPQVRCSLAARGSGPPRWTMTGGTACHATAQPPSSAPAPPSRLASSEHTHRWLAFSSSFLALHLSPRQDVASTVGLSRGLPPPRWRLVWGGPRHCFSRSPPTSVPAETPHGAVT